MPLYCYYTVRNYKNFQLNISILQKNFQCDGVTTDSDESSAENLTAEAANKWVLKVGRFILNNLDEFVWDDYANYPIRTVLLSLAGLPPTDSNSNQSQVQRSEKGSVPVNFSSALMKTEEEEVQEDVSLPDGFRELLKEYYERLSSWPQFSGTVALLFNILVTSKSFLKLWGPKR